MSTKHRRFLFRILAATLIAGVAFSLAGCGNFFVCDKSSCTSSGGGSSNSGDYAYLSNSTSGTTYLSGYSVSSGTLSSISSSFPTNLTFVSAALSVSPNNSYLYAGSTAGLIYAYGISSAGALTALYSGSAAASQATGISAMDVSPDGKFLFGLDTTGTALYEYQLNTSTGAVTFVQSFPITSSGSIAPQSVRVSPSGTFVVCALGTGGTVIFPYNSTNGITTTNFVSISTGSATAGDFGVAVDKNDFLYIAWTNGVLAYQLSSSSSTSVSYQLITQTNSPAFGNGPHPIVLSSTTSSNPYVYVGNLTDGTISAYSTSAGVLTNISGSPFSSAASVSALGRDNTGKYILALGYNSSAGVQIYTIGSNGALTKDAQAGSGTSGVPAVMALTH